jgi:amino acid transporter
MSIKVDPRLSPALPLSSNAPLDCVGVGANQIKEGAERIVERVVGAVVTPARPSLRQSCLSYSEVLAQSVSVVAPSTVPAALLGLIFARAGNATWLSFLLGALGLTLVGININQFARRSASPGSLYSYIVRGLSPAAGILGGWALLFGYTLTGMSTLCGFAIIANVLCRQLFGAQVAVVVLFALGALGSFCIAFRDVQLSAKMMLLFEGLSLLVVLFLGALVWGKARFTVDTEQLTLARATPGGALAGEVLVIFGFSGFESSTALGDEAQDPLKAIPRSVLQSVALAGAFFVSISYLVVLGYKRSGGSLVGNEAPLNALAAAIGWTGLGVLIDVGVLLSFFSCTLASINSTARILFAMAHHGVVHDALGHAHVENHTPHVAVGLSALITFAVPTALHAAGVSALDCQGYLGTLCGFGFIVVYMTVSVAAPVYLASLGKLTKKAMACAAGGVAFMLLPLLGTIGIPGSTLFPTSDAAGTVLVLIFASYMAVGLGWLMIQRVRRPTMSAEMRRAVEKVQDPCASVP